MSAKICLPAWNSGPHKTKDAITLGSLEQMIQALYGLGYDIDTPATFLFNDDHVWLETVEFEDLRIPRVVKELGKDEQGSHWVDRSGEEWRYMIPGDVGGHWVYYWEAPDTELSEWVEAEPTDNYGPYTEVME